MRKFLVIFIVSTRYCVHAPHIHTYTANFQSIYMFCWHVRTRSEPPTILSLLQKKIREKYCSLYTFSHIHNEVSVYWIICCVEVSEEFFRFLSATSFVLYTCASISKFCFCRCRHHSFEFRVAPTEYVWHFEFISCAFLFRLLLFFFSIVAFSMEKFKIYVCFTFFVIAKRMWRTSASASKQKRVKNCVCAYAQYLFSYVSIWLELFLLIILFTSFSECLRWLAVPSAEQCTISIYLVVCFNGIFDTLIPHPAHTHSLFAKSTLSSHMCATTAA